MQQRWVLTRSAELRPAISGCCRFLPLLGFVANGLLAMSSVVKFGPQDPSASHGDDHAHPVHAHDDHGHGGGEHDDHAVVRHSMRR